MALSQTMLNSIAFIHVHGMENEEKHKPRSNESLCIIIYNYFIYN